MYLDLMYHASLFHFGVVKLRSFTINLNAHCGSLNVALLYLYVILLLVNLFQHWAVMLPFLSRVALSRVEH